MIELGRTIRHLAAEVRWKLEMISSELDTLSILQAGIISRTTATQCVAFVAVIEEVDFTAKKCGVTIGIDFREQ